MTTSTSNAEWAYDALAAWMPRTLLLLPASAYRNASASTSTSLALAAATLDVGGLHVSAENSSGAAVNGSQTMHGLGSALPFFLLGLVSM